MVPEAPSFPVPSPSPDPAAAARHVLDATRQALEALQGSWDEAAVRAFTGHVLAGTGRLVVSGMGKSGLVGQKIAATLASTGCPAFYLHPADALHGDLGMVLPEDTVLLLSNSGETEEIVRLLNALVRMGAPIAAITSRRASRLGKAARWCFTYALPDGEGCPLHFAPMASTTLQLVWGDLLAAYHMVASGFTLERFAQFHPAGNIGARLLKVKQVMHEDLPQVGAAAGLVEALGAMTAGKLGMAAVIEAGALLGVISDGDIRRALQAAQARGANPLELTARMIMTANPVCVAPATLAVEAARTLQSRKITFLVVKDGERPCGVLHIHDLFAAKVI